MQAQAAQPTLLGRAARMLLVFFLVFGMSFHAEIAIADTMASNPDKLSSHAKGSTLTDMTVYQLDSADETRIGKSVRTVQQTVAESLDKFNPLEVARDGAIKFVAVPSWKEAESGSSSSSSAGSGSSSSSKSTSNLKVEAAEKDEKTVAVANYVEWWVDDTKVSTDNVFTLDAKTFGKKDAVTVTCRLNDDAKAYVSDEYKGKTDEQFKVAFTAQLAAAPHEIVSDLQCPLVGKGLEKGENKLELSMEDAASYQFTAKASWKVDSTGEGKTTDGSYSSDSGKSLSAATDGLFKDLKWELLENDAAKDPLDASIATIDQNGLLKVAKDSEFIVCCTASTADGSVVTTFEVVVTCGKPEQDEPDEKKADQGADHHQDSLRVIARVPSSAASSAAADASQSEGSETSKSADASGGVEAADDQGESPSSSSSEPGKSEVATLEKTFSKDDISALGSSRSDFNLRTSAASSITVTGEGPTLAALLTALGITNLEAVNEVKFVNYAESEVTVKWSAVSNAMVAVKSVVHDPDYAVDGATGSSSSSSSSSEASGGSSSAQAQGEESELLGNTRFRILSENLAAAEIDSLRWIKQIEVNPGQQADSGPEAPFTVSVSYAPSPIGQKATFSPIPSKEIAGATFEYVWEEAPGEDGPWESVSTDQTYQTLTTEERIGHLFRVTLKSDMVDEVTGKKYKATSKPVEMREGVGVSLVYDPPSAGGVASFVVNFSGFPSNFDFGKLEYIWELSDDGCKTWQKLADRYQGTSTLSIQTDPIDENAPQEDVTPIYIRCRVVGGEPLKKVTGNEVEIAGPQMLTVRTGDDGEKPKPEPQEFTPIQDDEPEEPKSTDKNKKENKKSKEKPDDEISYDDDDAEDNDATTPSDEGSSSRVDLSQIHINEEVSEKVREQQEAAQQQIENTVPGARWTKLSSSDKDPGNVLHDNPFVPFAIPTGLGLTAAGAVERILFFRRQR